MQQVCLARGRLRPWQAVMLGCLSADHDSAGLMFEVMARVLAAQAGSMPVTAAAGDHRPWPQH